jgi:hypothetical protein
MVVNRILEKNLITHPKFKINFTITMVWFKAPRPFIYANK